MLDRIAKPFVLFSIEFENVVAAFTNLSIVVLEGIEIALGVGSNLCD